MPIEIVEVPNIGNYNNLSVIEINVSVGDIIVKDDTLIVLEQDKGIIEIPSTLSGKVVEIMVKINDKVSQGSLILKVETHDIAISKELFSLDKSINTFTSSRSIYASPAVRKLARILNIDLMKVKGTGYNNRITKEDCHNYNNYMLKIKNNNISNATINSVDEQIINFSKFGKIEIQQLSNINKISGENLHRSWVKIPHVTFYDYADVTELEEFRHSKKKFAEIDNIKITPLSFLVKAASFVLQEFPKFNSSLLDDGENLIIKKYYNIGFASDTSLGLMVPVIKNVNKKGIIEISKDIIDLTIKARNGRLNNEDMIGSTFTISSLGILGNGPFTPIIKIPEVSILGASKISIKPIWNGREFVPRSMIPLSLSIDHRVIDGVLAVQFLTRYCQVLSDLRELIM